MKIKRILNPYIFLFISLMSFASCGVFKKKCLKADTLTDLPSDAPKKLGKSSFEYNYLNIKAKAEYRSANEKQSFSMAIRMKKDSVIWVSISGFGFEVVRALIDTDSVKVLNKLNKTYTAAGIEDLKRLVQFDVNLNQLQEIMVGNSPFPADQYALNNGEGSELFTKEAFIKNLLQLNSAFRITKNSLMKDGSADSLVVSYTDFQKLKKEGCIPGKIEANYASGKNILLINYNSVSTTKFDNLPFRIPASYKRAKK